VRKLFFGPGAGGGQAYGQGHFLGGNGWGRDWDGAGLRRRATLQHGRFPGHATRRSPGGFSTCARGPTAAGRTRARTGGDVPAGAPHQKHQEYLWNRGAYQQVGLSTFPGPGGPVRDHGPAAGTGAGGAGTPGYKGAGGRGEGNFGRGLFFRTVLAERERMRLLGPPSFTSGGGSETTRRGVAVAWGLLPL